MDIDTDSPVRIPLDTPAKRFYADQVRCLIAGDADRLVGDHYHPDATVQSFAWQVTGAAALRAHFARYLGAVRILEVVSTDAFAETPEGLAFEATVRTDQGLLRVYDVMRLRDGRIAFHFTGTR